MRLEEKEKRNMAISRQSRNIIIGAAAAVLIVAILAFLLGRGCGKEYGSTATGTTPAVTTGTTTTRKIGRAHV